MARSGLPEGSRGSAGTMSRARGAAWAGSFRRTAARRSCRRGGAAKLAGTTAAVTLSPYCESGSPKTAASRTLGQVSRMAATSAGDHLVGAAVDRDAAVSRDLAQVRGGEPAVLVQRDPGEVGAAAVAGEQDRAGDLDPAGRVGADPDAIQGSAVVDAAAAGLGHAVGRDDAGSGGARAGQQAGRDGRAAEQDRAERRQARARVQQAAQLRGNQGHIPAAERGQVPLRRIQPVDHHRGGPGDQGADQYPQAGDVAGGQRAQPPGSGAGADPVQAGPRRGEQCVRAELGTLGLTG